MKKFWLVMLPLIVFIAGVSFLYQGLFSDPRQLDSQVTGKPVPAFSLPALMNSDTTYTESVLKGKVTILNVWGVWCITCAVELPYLTQLREDEGVRFVGLYFDQDIDPDFGARSLPEVQKEVTAMLKRFGSPYQFNIYDTYRDLSLDLGVTGAPEHFVIDAQGTVRLHHVGDINERVWRNKIQPVYQQLQQEHAL